MSLIFSPISGLVGGSLIGLSASALLLGNGSILGFSGILSSMILNPVDTVRSRKNRWKFFFLSSFCISANLCSSVFQTNTTYELETERKISTTKFGLAIAGLLVGFGTKLSNGCTSGHGICGLARFSKRSLVAVCTFMSTGLIVSSNLSPDGPIGKFLLSAGRNDHFSPTNASNSFKSTAIGISILAIATFLSINRMRNGEASEELTRSDMAKDRIENTRDVLSIGSKTEVVAVITGALFALGLMISGMTKTYKIHDFLDLRGMPKGSWDGTLICVMGGGVLISSTGYQFVKGFDIFSNHKKVLFSPLFNEKFNIPTSTNIDRNLLLGSALFGVGWAIGNACPGPALFLAATGYPQMIQYWIPAYAFGAFMGEKVK
jgi:uncharacterized membrane protein YedE/YeeE